jgi:hypothetical protein
MSHAAEQTHANTANANGVGSGGLVRRLANDIARCNGSGSVEDGVQYWREGCESCLRRTAPRPARIWMIAPPLIIAFECEYLILPNGSDEARRAKPDVASG